MDIVKYLFQDRADINTRSKYGRTAVMLAVSNGHEDIAQWASPLDGGFSRKNIFCQKIFDNFFSFQATEMVLTSKWGRIQQEIQI